MAKNKGKFGKGKSDVELEDEFISGMGQLAKTLQPHAFKLILLGCGAFLLLVGYTVWEWQKRTKAEEATAAYASAIEVAAKRVEPPAEPVEGEDAPPPATTGDAFPSESARSQAIIDALGDSGSTQAAASSQLLAARAFMKMGRYDEAATAFGTFAQSKVPASLKAMGREGVGYAIEAKALAEKDPQARAAGLDKAIAAFANMADTGERGAQYAEYHQARLLATLDRRDAAAEKYKKLLETLDEQNPLGDEVESRLAALEGGASAPVAPPEDDAPEDDAPEDDAPEDDAPEDDAPEDDAPEDPAKTE